MKQSQVPVHYHFLSLYAETMDPPVLSVLSFLLPVDVSKHCRIRGKQCYQWKNSVDPDLFSQTSSPNTYYTYTVNSPNLEVQGTL